jgi:hypothetical protein
MNYLVITRILYSLNPSSEVNSLFLTNNAIIEKYCYDNSDANCVTYEGFYQWNELMQYVTTDGAQGLYPSEWHVATDRNGIHSELFLVKTGHRRLRDTI